MFEQQLERLVERGIHLLAAVEIETHFIFERDGFVALVGRRENEFGSIGAPGLLAGPGGYAALVWRGGEPWFISRGFEQPATAEQVIAIRKFDHDLRYAIEGGGG